MAFVFETQTLQLTYEIVTLQLVYLKLPRPGCLTMHYSSRQNRLKRAR